MTIALLALSLLLASQPSTLNPRRGGPRVQEGALPDATVARPYTHTFTAKGGVPPYDWGPRHPLPWLSLSSSGTLSGTPAQCGTFSFTVELADGASQRWRGEFSVRVSGCR